MVASGTAKVRVEIISAPASPTKGVFAVQIGAFADRTNAERLRDQLMPRYQPISIFDSLGPNGRLFRLRIGSVPNEAAAQQLASKLRSEDGFETFVVRLDDSQRSSSTDGGSQP
jgi:rare lipoprotein A